MTSTSSSRVEPELVRAVHGDERSDRDQAAVALSELGTLPDVAEDDPFGQLDELGCERAEVSPEGCRLLTHDEGSSGPGREASGPVACCLTPP